MGDEHMERRVNALEVALAESRADLRNHIIMCDRRAAIIQKLSWWILGIVVAVLGVLLKAQLHILG